MQRTQVVWVCRLNKCSPQNLSNFAWAVVESDLQLPVDTWLKVCQHHASKPSGCLLAGLAGGQPAMHMHCTDEVMAAAIVSLDAGPGQSGDTISDWVTMPVQVAQQGVLLMPNSNAQSVATLCRAMGRQGLECALHPRSCPCKPAAPQADLQHRCQPAD